jgi:hypothetical protein
MKNLNKKYIKHRCHLDSCKRQAKWLTKVNVSGDERTKQCTKHMKHRISLYGSEHVTVEKIRDADGDTECHRCYNQGLVGYCRSLDATYPFLCGNCAGDLGVHINRWYDEPNESDDSIVANDQEQCDACGSRWFSEKTKDPNGNDVTLCSDCRRDMMNHDDEDRAVEDPYPMPDPEYGSEDYDIIMNQN